MTYHPEDHPLNMARRRRWHRKLIQVKGGKIPVFYFRSNVCYCKAPFLLAYICGQSPTIKYYYLAIYIFRKKKRRQRRKKRRKRKMIAVVTKRACKLLVCVWSTLKKWPTGISYECTCTRQGICMPAMNLAYQVNTPHTECYSEVALYSTHVLHVL